MKVAVVGLGHMGLGMARNLLKAGHEVVALTCPVKSWRLSRRMEWQPPHPARKQQLKSKLSSPCFLLAGTCWPWRTPRLKDLRGCDGEPTLMNTTIDGEVIGNIYENPDY